MRVQQLHHRTQSEHQGASTSDDQLTYTGSTQDGGLEGTNNGISDSQHTVQYRLSSIQAWFKTSLDPCNQIDKKTNSFKSIQ